MASRGQRGQSGRGGRGFSNGGGGQRGRGSFGGLGATSNPMSSNPKPQSSNPNPTSSSSPSSSSSNAPRGGGGGRGSGRGGRNQRGGHEEDDQGASVNLDSLPIVPLPPIVDIGLNLTHKQFDRDREAVLARGQRHHVSAMILTGTSERHSQLASDYAARHAGVLYSTAGVHPHDAKHFTPQTLVTLRALLTLKHVVAVGECGLDFDRDFSPRDVQESVFGQQIRLAGELNRPLFCHERIAHDRFVAVLDANATLNQRVCVHCFTGSRSEVEDYVKRGYYIGITGWICDERRGDALRAAVSAIPLDRLMIETDAPFLTPRDLPSSLRSLRRNEPCLLPRVLSSLAHCLNIDPALLAEHTTRNAVTFFGLSENNLGLASKTTSKPLQAASSSSSSSSSSPAPKA